MCWTCGTLWRFLERYTHEHTHKSGKGLHSSAFLGVYTLFLALHIWSVGLGDCFLLLRSELETYDTL